jgi:hypothetical protein
MKICASTLLGLSLILVSNANGFEGYEQYPMKGNAIFPLRNVDVKMSEIKISMERKENDITTKVTAEYVLNNLSNEKTHFKVAFPVESNCPKCTKMPDDFRVSVDGKSIQTSTAKLIERDLLSRMASEISLKDARREYYPPTKIEERKDEIPLITWEISFKPKEKRLVRCTYTTEWIGDPGTEYFEYNLSALYLWQGTIEKASFKLILPQELISNIKRKRASLWPKIIIHPSKYMIKNDAIEWHFANLKQQKIGYISVKIDHRKPGVVGE